MGQRAAPLASAAHYATPQVRPLPHDFADALSLDSVTEDSPHGFAP